MLVLIIRYFFLIYCALYAHIRIINLKLPVRIQTLCHFIFSLLLCTIIPFLTQNYKSTFRFSVLFICYIIFTTVYLKTNLLHTTAISIISFAMSYLALSISAFILSIIVTLSTDFIILSNPYFVFLGGLLQNLLIYLLFRIKRLNNGMPFLLNNTLFNLGICISATVIFYNEILQRILSFTWSIQLIFIIIVPFFAIALLIWWRRKITQSYVEKLRVSEVETLYKEISDKNLEIEKLRANNEQLAGIIHKDNKLIPAMELAVRNYLQTATLMKPEDAQQMGTDLLAKLERMSEERTGIIRTYQEANSYRQRCGLASIDAIVAYMENRATELGIEYHYQYDKGIKEMLPAYIGEDDAMHLLSDVIENAIIASNHNEKKTVHIHIGFIQSTLFMDISDSGIPFDPETYQNLGLLQHTPHKEHGGSGICLKDLGKFKKQYKFSLHIYEYPETEPVYTKKIRILFDKKNHYLIQSYRAGEIRTAITRNDLHIFQYTDTQNEFPTLDDKSKQFT